MQLNGRFFRPSACYWESQCGSDSLDFCCFLLPTFIQMCVLDVRESTQNQLLKYFGFMVWLGWGFNIGAGVTFLGL